MAIKKETIGDKLTRVRRLFKQRDNATGMLYNRKDSLKRAYTSITLWGLFVSDENTFLLRPHLLESREKRNAKQWSAWLGENYGTILRDGILPGMHLRTEKHWRLYRIIGWISGDNRRSLYTSPRKPRHKAKRTRR